MRNLLFVFVLVLLLPPTFAFAGESYVRFGAGHDRSADAIVRDRDCTDTQPPALFGCVAGPDGRPLAARGDFGRSAAFELGIGSAMTRRTRLELALTSRPKLGLDAQANFLAAGDAQPVHAAVRSLAAFALISFELAPAEWKIRPFVVAGPGAARNHVGAVRYEFPTIGPGAVTVTSGGSTTSFAWTAGAGAAIPLTPGVALDLTFRHTDLGTIATSPGPATIVRPTRTLTLDIAGTRARLRTRGVMVSLRIRR